METYDMNILLSLERLYSSLELQLLLPLALQFLESRRHKVANKSVATYRKYILVVHYCDILHDMSHRTIRNDILEKK